MYNTGIQEAVKLKGLDKNTSETSFVQCIMYQKYIAVVLDEMTLDLYLVK